MPNKFEKKAKAKIKYDNTAGVATVTGDDFSIKIKLSTTQLSQMYFSGSLIATDVYFNVALPEETPAVEPVAAEETPPLAMPEMEDVVVAAEEAAPAEPVEETPVEIPITRKKSLDEVIKEAEELVEGKGAAGPSPKKDESEEEPPHIEESENVDNEENYEPENDEEDHGNEDDEKSDIEKSFDREIKRHEPEDEPKEVEKEWRGGYSGSKRSPFDSN